MHGRRIAVIFALAIVLAGCNLKVSDDPFTNATSQHKTEVEPDSFAYGSTVVSAFQTGRFFDGGASDIGFAVSTDAGANWSHGVLPGLTNVEGSGSYDRTSDPSVAYDARHGVWLVASLGLRNGETTFGGDVVVSRSTNGGNSWNNPVTVGTGTDYDKEWIACDNSRSSRHYGHCYVEADSTYLNGVSQGAKFTMWVSTNGGASWAPSTVPDASVVGGQPLVQPNGTVIVPIHNNYFVTPQIESFVSTDGGKSYTGPHTIATPTSHDSGVNDAFRDGEFLPSADIDATGLVYVVWSDCRFRTSCSTNDLVMSTSADGISWSDPIRIPIDAATSTVDHFIPGVAVDNATSGAGAHIALAYYYFPDAGCTETTCQLDVGFISSVNGGSTWSAAAQLDGPMSLDWLPKTTQGRMVGDYISTSISGGKAWPFYASASAPTGASACDLNVACDESMNTVLKGVAITGGNVASGSATSAIAGAPSRTSSSRQTITTP